MNYWLNPYEDGQSPPGEFPGVSELGSLIHAALAEYDQCAEQGTTGHGVYMYRRDNDLLDSPEYEAEGVKAVHYADRFIEWMETRGEDVGTTLVGAELKLEVPVPGTEHVVYGTIDRLSTGPSGLRVMDYKSSKQFRQMMPNDFQILTYAWMLRAAGYGTPTTGTYARIKTVKTTKTGEPQDLVDTTITDEILDQHEDHLAGVILEVEAAVTMLDQGMAPRRLRPVTSTDCSWRCDGLAACTVMSAGGYWEDVLPYPSGPSAGFNQRGSTS